MSDRCVSDYRAYSMTWPWFAFAENFGQVFLVNLYEKDKVHKINIEPELYGNKECAIQIFKTFITQKNFTLYVLAFVEGFYQVY